jgi:hypothetical protein
MGEQAILPSFDPLSVYFSQVATMQKAEDAFDNASIALNIAKGGNSQNPFSLLYLKNQSGTKAYRVRINDTSGSAIFEIDQTPIIL